MFFPYLKPSRPPVQFFCDFANKSLIWTRIWAKETRMHPVYLDHNATTPMKPAVQAAVCAALAECGNASSIHAIGRAARAKVEGARGQVAALVGAAPAQVIFTSGATEANNTVLKTFEKLGTVAVAGTEHPSVRDGVAAPLILPVTGNGLLDFDALAEIHPVLVSVMLVNNETGVIQDIPRLAALLRPRGIRLHVDAVQAAGRIPVSFNDLGCDYLTLSAHKMGGPQGVGALIVSESAPPVRLLTGGGQEKRQRAGTENVAGIVGFGVAAQLAAQDMPAFQALAALRDAMEHTIRAQLPDVIVFGADAPRVANTSCFALLGVDAATQLMALDLAGFCVSNGSACSSGTVKASPVLTAMGVAPEVAKCALRVSLGWNTTEADVKDFTARYIDLAKGWTCRT